MNLLKLGIKYIRKFCSCDSIMTRACTKRGGLKLFPVTKS